MHSKGMDCIAWSRSFFYVVMDKWIGEWGKRVTTTIRYRKRQRQTARYKYSKYIGNDIVVAVHVCFFFFLCCCCCCCMRNPHCGYNIIYSLACHRVLQRFHICVKCSFFPLYRHLAFFPMVLQRSLDQRSMKANVQRATHLDPIEKTTSHTQHTHCTVIVVVNNATFVGTLEYFKYLKYLSVFKVLCYFFLFSF